MTRPTLAELEPRCQKPDYRRVGNWLARRVSRPLALRVTWWILPSGISAHAATAIAMLWFLAAVALFVSGNVWAWCAAVACLHAWYLFDHVDGQLARYHGTASLDGVQLDYLMHHSVYLLLPWAMAAGIWQTTSHAAWLLAGGTWCWGATMLALTNDTQYKAFFERLKRVRGRLEVVGGPCHAEVSPPSRRGLWRRAAWLARKFTETHVTLLILPGVVAIDAAVWPQQRWLSGIFVLAMAIVTPLVAGAVVLRGLRRHDTETAFKQWFQPPPGNSLTDANGCWEIAPRSDTTNHTSPPAPPSRSAELLRQPA